MESAESDRVHFSVTENSTSSVNPSSTEALAAMVTKQMADMISKVNNSTQNTNTTSTLLQTLLFQNNQTSNNELVTISTTTNSTEPFRTDSANNTREITTVLKPEVDEDSGITIAEQVVIGAVCLVGVLAIIAIILRLVMPYFRKQQELSAIKPSVSSATLLQDKLQQDRKLSSLTGYSNIAADISSQSSGSGSSPGADWSESDSSQTRTTICSEDSQIAMAGSYGNIRGSSLSLPVYLPPDSRSLREDVRGGNSYNRSRKLNDDLMSVISTQSLEPVKMEETYRNRWDDEWDPYGSLPRSTLSHYSHPSESSLCEARFPTPSREQIQKIQKDKQRRYPNKKFPDNRKEKNVRMETPPKR